MITTGSPQQNTWFHSKMASAKRHVLLTGPPGIGKTTLCKRVNELLISKSAVQTQGFYTEEVQNNNGTGRLGFDVVTLTGERGPLARLKEPGRQGPSVGRYIVDLKSFEKLAISTMKYHPGNRTSVVIVDEIGKMELFSKPFTRAVRELFESPEVCILATVPVARQRPIPFVEQLKERADVTLVEVTRANRSNVANEILDLIVSALPTKTS